MPGEEPAHHRADIREDADDPDAGEVEVGRPDVAATDVNRRRRHKGDRGDAKHGLVEVGRNSLVFSHTAPNTTRIQAPSSDNAGMPGSRPPNGSLAEPPLRVESREELVYLLGEACELEHGLLCEDLYAQFSLKRTVEEGLTQEQLARLQAWVTTVIDVVQQEMLQSALVTHVPTERGASRH